MIEFRVNCTPIAQPRQRHTRDGRNYTPKGHPVQAYKQLLRLRAPRFSPLLSGPVVLDLLFLMPRPQRLIWKKKPMPRLPHTSTPDLDNLVKAFKDALTGHSWHDDRQIFLLNAEKLYAAGDEEPGVDVKFREALDGTAEL